MHVQEHARKCALPTREANRICVLTSCLHGSSTSPTICGHDVSSTPSNSPPCIVDDPTSSWPPAEQRHPSALTTTSARPPAEQRHPSSSTTSRLGRQWSDNTPRAHHPHVHLAAGMDSWMSAHGAGLEERRPERCAALKQMLSSPTMSHRTTTPTWPSMSGR